MSTIVRFLLPVLGGALALACATGGSAEECAIGGLTAELCDESERMVVDGARIFHSADELGSTIAVSCHMFHDPRLRAMEADIYAQRSGTPLAYGKH